MYPQRNKAWKNRSVVVVGVGALGTAAASELAAGPITRIGLVDGDRVELSNLHRQLLHGPDDVGRPKAEVAAEKLASLHPTVRIESRFERFVPGDVGGILDGHDVAVDATDNGAAKFGLNDACVERGVPLVHAGVVGLGGQLLTIVPYETACLRCLFPEPPDDDEVASCRDAGILGPLAAMVGILQAREALALLEGTEARSAGRLTMIDGRSLRMREIPLRLAAACPVCGPVPRRIDAAADPARLRETR